MSRPSSGSSRIEIIGADANNLKDAEVHFPLGRISVVTGISGSGKSSLLDDTLAAEGSRRMRLFLGDSQRELEGDDVRAFIGPLPPTVLVGQQGFRPSVRTTVGTATGFLGVLRRLFLIASAPFSDLVGAPVPPPSPEIYRRWLAKHYQGTAEIWTCPVRHQQTDGKAAVQRLKQWGVERFRVYSEKDPASLGEKGREMRTSDFKGLKGVGPYTIEACLGTLSISRSTPAGPLSDLLERAFTAGSGSVVVMLPDSAEPDLAGPYGPRLDAERHWVHPDSPEIFFPPTAHLLSFNSPGHEMSGACRACNGTGIGHRLNEDKLIPHPHRSMSRGAFALWTEKNYKYLHIQHATIEGLRGMQGFSPDVAWSDLPPAARRLVLDGTGEELVVDRDRSGRKIGAGRPFPGFRTIILDKAQARTKTAARLAEYVEAGPCEACDGTRWSFQARALRVVGHGVHQILARDFAQVERLTQVGAELASAVAPAAKPFVEGLHRHARSIVSVGLGYLAADRGMLEVSEGESRRIRLARVLDAGEQKLCLLLDEPARGLHEVDLVRMTTALERLRGAHTVILNEHRERLWQAADWLVELGPGAGATGGEVTYSGLRRDHPGHLDEGPLRTALPIAPDHPRLEVLGASIHNVENADCAIPLGRLTCLCGVSGSGKSSLLRGVLAPALLYQVGGDASDFVLRDGKWNSVSGADALGEVIALDQTMPPANRRSLVATFTGVFDGIRKVFGSSAPAAREGLSATDFGVNAGQGRCRVCMGTGEVTHGDLRSLCSACGGARYGHRALAVRVAGTNVQELLETPMEDLRELAEIFRVPPGLVEALCDLGLGYVALGRRIDTLSGGEVQRLRLALRLGQRSAQPAVFLLDEPAVGLHPRDVKRLAAALDRVLDGGRNTLILVEHDLRLVRAADWIVELGPGSGPEGGEIIFAGPPGELAKARTPTGLALAGELPPAEASPEREPPNLARPPLAEQVERTRTLLRTLMDGGATVPASAGLGEAAGDGLAEPVVVVSEHFWAGRDGWEVAGLDCELPKLLLDVARPSTSQRFARLLAAWQEEPDAWLAIHPFLANMQVWETELPLSVLETTAAHVASEALHLVTLKGRKLETVLDLPTVRATGERFEPDCEDPASRRQALRDAFSIGAGFVELRSPDGSLLAMTSDRLLNLGKGLVAPLAPVPSHFSRHHRRGRCLLCEGTRVVADLQEELVIGDRRVPPVSDRFLTPAAHAVMKGVRRNELMPFLRRLAEEGLWDLDAPFGALDPQQREMVLFGFWRRPGAGSFLKSAKRDPDQVSSWLRWDGLYRHLLAQAHRSRDSEWSSRLRRSTRPLRCPLCQGTGLHRFAALLQVGDVPFSRWVLMAEPARQLDLLQQVAVETPRQRRTLQRLLHCLAPLGEPAGTVAEVVERAVATFTTMAVATDHDPGAS